MTDIIDDTYHHSTALQKLRSVLAAGQTARVAFFDIDGTLTGEPSDQAALREKLAQLGYVTVLVTARTIVMCQRAADRMQGLLEADIVVGSLGSEIALRQNNGEYRPDVGYGQSLPYSAEQWHRRVEELLLWLAPAGTSYTDWYAATTFPPYWVQLGFPSAETYHSFRRTLQQRQQEPSRFPGSSPALRETLQAIVVTDESDPWRDPPQYLLFLTPHHVGKRQAVDYLVRVLTPLLATQLSALQVLIVGDGPSDLAMGLLAAAGTQTTFLVPGGSRLTHYLREHSVEFLGEELASLAAHVVPQQADFSAVRSGFYLFGADNRQVIIGDEAFPETSGPQTILTYLNLR